jgi:hypothetical protein
MSRLASPHLCSGCPDLVIVILIYLSMGMKE